MIAAPTLWSAVALALAPAPARSSETAPQGATAWGCNGALCGEDELRPFFARLSGMNADDARPVHVLQLGDSHTANDNLTGAWRARLQARYGGGGRGVLPPGRPYAGYVTRQVTVAETPGWRHLNTVTAERTGAHPAFGAAGERVTATTPGAELTLTADAGDRFDLLEVCAETSTTQTRLAVQLDGVERVMDLQASSPGARCETLAVDGARDARVRALDQGATVLSWAVLRRGPGVVLSNLGVVGAGLRHLAPQGDAVLAAELDAYQPSLIVLAYGVNDGFGPVVDGEAYAAQLTSVIRRLQRLAPDAALLLLEAPDAQARARAIGSAPRAWVSPEGLRTVRAAQEQVARQLHMALWRWSAEMGGEGAADRWASASPPLMRPDHVHFTAAGGARLAAALRDALEAAAERAKAP